MAAVFHVKKEIRPKKNFSTGDSQAMSLNARMLIATFYDYGAPCLWGVVIGVLTAFLFTKLAKAPTLSSVTGLAAFISGAAGTKYLFQQATNAAIFYYLVGLVMLWLFYWALYTRVPGLKEDK